MMSVGGLAVVIGADKWFNLVQGFLDDWYPNLSDYLLVLLIMIMVVIGIYYYKTNQPKKQPLTQEQRLRIGAKISHSHDLKKFYERMSSIKSDTDEQNHLIFYVTPPLMYDPNERTDLEETRRRILEHNNDLHDGWTPLSVVSDTVHALQHLKDREYKNINKKWKKANKLLKKYNKNNKEQTKIKMDETLQEFRQGLLTLVDRLDNNHIMKGKCDVCP